jgi:hypothetical protein
MAASGHKDMSVAQKYIEEAFNRPELADAAFDKVRTKRNSKPPEGSFCSPETNLPDYKSQSPTYKSPAKSLKNKES